MRNWVAKMSSGILPAVERMGLGQVLDIVPNHMAIGPQNRYWWMC